MGITRIKSAVSPRYKPLMPSRKHSCS